MIRLPRWNLAYHPKLQAFICTSCRKGIYFHHIRRHLRTTHKQVLAVSDLADVLASHPPHSGPYPTLPIFSDGRPMVAIPHVDVVSGFACKLCIFFSPSPGTMKNHFFHSHYPLVQAGHTNQSLIQNLAYATGRKPYFSVHPAPPSSTPTFYEHFLAALPPQPAQTELAVPEDRSISPLMRQLGWHSHVAGYRPVELVDLVAGPQKQPHWMRLRDWVEEYMAVVQLNIKTSPNHYLLRLINSTSSAM